MFYTEKLALVSGGTGFVGLHIVQELLKRGARVRVPIHRRPLVLEDARIETVQADLTRLEDCMDVVEGVDYIFHAAGAVAAAGVSQNHFMSAITTNLVLTSQMLQAAWSANVERFLLFSSHTIYPAADYPVKEEDGWTGPPYSSYFGYGWMRRYLERLGEFVAKESAMKIAVVRPSATYGRWDDFDPATSHVVPALIRKAVCKQDPYEIWGSGEEIRDLLHVTDLARGCALMLEKYAVCDPVNIAYGKGVTIKHVANIILKAAGNDDARVEFDASKPTQIPVRMVDTSKAKAKLGFEPEVSLEDGLTDTVNWYAKMRGKQE